MHALLLLADGRFPAGGHAHSAGVEAAVQDGRITDVVSLTAFTEGRLRTVGLVDIAFAMATAVHLGPSGPAEREAPGPSGPAEQEARGQPPDDATAHRLLRTLDVEVDARTPAPPLRAASRRLGRQLVRVGARCWPSALLDLVVEAGFDPHQAVAFGLVGLAGGLGVEDIGHLVAHHTVTTPMLAGVRLLGLDPFAVAASMAALSVVAAAVITAAVDQAAGPIETLPARSASLIDLAAVTHATADGRLFAT
ncbi:MAG TPA: urease accessory UreF family protein [Acidimicrobiales bacterium]|nr:urease accessory UreF family protein [Acidimicrobiales bacterium]